MSTSAKPGDPKRQSKTRAQKPTPASQGFVGGGHTDQDTVYTPTVRIGRPVKAPTPGKRASLGLLVTPELKHRLEQASRASGKTISAEAEALLNQGLAVADVLTAMRTTVPELARRQAEKNFRERGYTVIHDPAGDIWLPPGHPAAPASSGFIPPAEEED